MSAKPLKAAVRYQANIAIIELQGEINALAEEILKTVYAEAVGPNPEAILLNLGNVKYITSTGMAILVGLVAQAHHAKIRLAACGLSDHYREVFQITRMTDYMEIFPNEATALANL